MKSKTFNKKSSQFRSTITKPSYKLKASTIKLSLKCKSSSMIESKKCKQFFSKANKPINKNCNISKPVKPKTLKSIVKSSQPSMKPSMAQSVLKFHYQIFSIHQLKLKSKKSEVNSNFVKANSNMLTKANQN